MLLSSITSSGACDENLIGSFGEIFVEEDMSRCRLGGGGGKYSLPLVCEKPHHLSMQPWIIA